MANTIGWGKGTQNNTNGWGKYQNTINAGSVYADSYAGETVLVGTSAAFSYSKSSFHQDESDPTPTITGTTGGTFSATPSGLSINTSTGTIDLDNSTIQSYTITYTVSGVSANQTLAVTASPFIANDFSMQFDGVSGQNINIGTISSLNSASAFTIGFWAKLSTPQSNDGVIFTNRVDNNNRITIYRYNSLIYFHINVSGSKNGNVSAPAVNTWTHIAMVFDGSGSANADRLKVYYNGVEQTLSFGGTMPATTGTYSTSYIGARGDGTNEYNGFLDEFAIWNAALSSDAVTEIYNATANNTGKVLDLNTDSGNYNASSNLVYFNRLGD